MAEYLTVSALTQYLRRKFTADPYLKEVYLTGEVSNFRLRNGHQYFSLKDDQAVIGVTIFKNVFAKVPFKLEEGMKVNVVGHVDLYARGGSYSLIIEKIEPDGIGSLYQALAQLKEKLSKAGTFDLLQRPISRFPKKIAVITSPSGAVIRDIMTTVRRRYPIAEIVLYPAVVQGEGAVPSLLKQLDAVRASGDYDTLIIGRGGGSIEDLWAFNDETLAMKLTEMPMPVISSVGHETDTTIADFVADRRAATPTAAAELATPVPLTELVAGLKELEIRMLRRVQQQVNHAQQRLGRVQESYVLTQPMRLYEGKLQQLDQLQYRLRNVMQQQITTAQHEFTLQQNRLVPALSRMVEQQQNRLAQAAKGLDLVSPLAVLGRGYSLVSTDKGIVRTSEDVAIGDQITVRLEKSSFTAVVTGKEEQ